MVVREVKKDPFYVKVCDSLYSIFILERILNPFPNWLLLQMLIELGISQQDETKHRMSYSGN